MSAVVKQMLAKQSKREFAYSTTRSQQCCSETTTWSNVIDVAGRFSNRSSANSLYRYPSPDRPAYSPSRPITVFRRSAKKTTCDIGYQTGIAIHQGADRTNSGATYKTTIGVRLCKRHQSSSRQWQYSVWQVALKVTQNAALPVQVRALLPQKCWAQIAQAQCLLVQPSAYFATTQVSTAAAKLDNRAHLGRTMNKDRRRGFAPAAVLRFGDESTCSRKS